MGEDCKHFRNAVDLFSVMFDRLQNWFWLITDCINNTVHTAHLNKKQPSGIIPQTFGHFQTMCKLKKYVYAANALGSMGSCHFDRCDIWPDLCGHDSFKGCKVANSLHKNDYALKLPYNCEKYLSNFFYRVSAHRAYIYSIRFKPSLWFVVLKTSCKKYPQWY